MLVSVLLVAMLTVTADFLRRRLFPRTPALLAAVLSLFVLLAAQSVAQGIFYYLGLSLNVWTDLGSSTIAILVVGVAAFWDVLPFFRKTSTPPITDDEPVTEPMSWPWSLAALLPGLVAAAFILRGASHVATLESIRTPWPMLPAGTLAAFAILVLATWLAAIKSRSQAVTMLLGVMTLWSMTLLTILIYRLGFGFDGFLHRASEQVLATTGTLNPKPPYYLGQYVFVTWLARLVQAPIRIIDLWLVPILSGLIPLTIPVAFGMTPRSRMAIAALFGLLPLSAFIATTPQSFAYLLGVVAILLALGRSHDRATAIPTLAVTAWALLTHPLAGLPFAGAVVALLWSQRKTAREEQTLRSPITWMLVLGTALSVPLAFFVSSLISHTPIAWDFSAFRDWQTYTQALTGWFTIPKSHIALWADWATFVAFLFLPALLVLGGLAAWLDREERQTWTLLLLLGLGVALSGFVLKLSGEFTFLIGYERGNYADRLFLVAGLFWLIPALASASLLVHRFAKKPVTNIVTILLFVAAWGSASAYLALPRHDATMVGHGWSVGQADVDAVHTIEEDAAGRPYIVLANQSVSAAAVESFGFKRYVKDPSTGEQIFYYPLPTGGPLYALFLRAVMDEPTRETVHEAASLGQTDLAYVVLDDYWFNAPRIDEALSAVADVSRDVDGGKTRIYRFDFRTEHNH